MSVVGQVGAPEGLPGRGGEFEDHEAGPRLEYPGRFLEPSAQVGQVPNPEADGRAIEVPVGKGKVEGIGGDRDGPGALVPAADQHRVDEVGADDPTQKPG